MGTRSVISATVGGVLKVAQYAQWDGYPSGQGRTCLEFIKKFMSLGDEDKQRILGNFAACTQIEERDVQAQLQPHPGNWPHLFPQWSRDTGAEILGMIAEKPLQLLLEQNDEHGLYAGLDPAYTWAIDFDAQTICMNAAFTLGFDEVLANGVDWAVDYFERGGYGELEPVPDAGN